MNNELSYLSAEGHTVFTSRFHRKRGTCCKSACVHCPFGFTIKKHGLQFRPAGDADSSFLDQLTGSVDWRSFLPDNVLVVTLKGQTCGFLVKNHIVVKGLFLLPEYADQGISRELVESYLFI
jgi:hypothetical protein